jgi:PAS domain S-box-containing protein
MIRPYQILVIEDDPEHAELIRRGFRNHDEFFLDFASSGEDGLELISRKSYDLISVDLVLPGIGGLDVLVRIRKFDLDLPVVMVSGHGTTEMAVVAFENRATKYVVKSMESFRSLPYIFENLIIEARFKVSERKMMEQIERSERIHRNIVENAMAGIYILQEGEFKLANPKLGEIFGCAPESLIGMPFWQMVKPDEMECVRALDRSHPGKAPIYESKITRKDGTTRWIEFRTVPIEYEGKRAMLGNLLDITQRKEQEMDLAKNNRELTALNNIMNRGLRPGTNLNRNLEDCLSDLCQGIEGLEVGGIFLRDGGNLVLQALFGPIEELMGFVKERGASYFFGQPRIERSVDGVKSNWLSAPLAYSGRAVGAIVVSPKGGDPEMVLPTLQKMADQIACMIEVCCFQQRAMEPAQILRPVGGEHAAD